MTDTPLPQLSDRERSAGAEAGIAVFADRLSYLPIGGFEYLDRVYVDTTPGAGHGSVVAWQQGLPPGWERTGGDRSARVAADLPALFAQLVLENDPWQVNTDDGTQLRDAVAELAGRGDPHAQSAAVKLRRLVQATVLDWRAAFDAGTLVSQRRLRHLALQRAATDDDLDLMQALVAQGCDPAEPVRGGHTPIDVALTGRGLTVVRWLLERRVPVDHTLRVGARAVDLALAEELLDRGASVDASAVFSAADNNDERVVDLLSEALPPDADRPDWLLDRLRTRAAQATAAGERQRAAVLTEVADGLTARP